MENVIELSNNNSTETVFWRFKKSGSAQRATGNRTNYKFMEWATYRLMGAGNAGYFCQHLLLSRQIFLAEVATVGFMVSPGGQSQLVTAQSGCTQWSDFIPAFIGVLCQSSCTSSLHRIQQFTFNFYFIIKTGHN